MKYLRVKDKHPRWKGGICATKLFCKFCNKDFIGHKTRQYCSQSCNAKSRKGERSPGWKGGRRVNSQGYIDIYNPTHPFADSKSCVPEHRLIMENYLGRFLDPQEVVHHINEIRTDNRIENLKLFANDKEHSKIAHPDKIKIAKTKYLLLHQKIS